MMSKSLERWLRNHSRRFTCPPCNGKKSTEIYDNSTIQAPCICPKCGKIWLYKVINHGDKFEKWRASWGYSKNQFGDKNDCQGINRKTEEIT